MRNLRVYQNFNPDYVGLYHTVDMNGAVAAAAPATTTTAAHTGYADCSPGEFCHFVV